MIFKQLILISAGLVFFSSSAVANWTLAPSVLVQESYNDNLTLLNEGDKVTDFITELTPSIGLAQRSRVLDLALNYRMQNLVYAKESRYNKTYSQFRGNATANLVRDIFFIDASASYGQQMINNAGTISLNNASITRNRTNATVASVRPYIEYRLGRLAELYLAAERGIVRYSTPELRGSGRNSYDAVLRSGSAFRRLLWQLDYSKQDISSSRGDTLIQSYNGEVEYRLTPRLGLLSSVGYDDNLYDRSGIVTNPRGSRWSAGFNWTATRHTTVRASVGRRYFGNTRSLTVTNRARRTDVSIVYSETITVLATTLFAANERVVDDEGSGIPELGSELDPSLPTDNGAAYVRKRLMGNFSLRSGSSLLTLSVFDENRVYETITREESVRGGSLAHNWNISQRLRVISQVSGQYSDLSLRGTSKYLRASVGVENRLSPRLVSSFNLSHNQQKGRRNYDQNIVYARIVWQM